MFSPRQPDIHILHIIVGVDGIEKGFDFGALIIDWY